jgi:hypothetical protein
MAREQAITNISDIHCIVKAKKAGVFFSLFTALQIKVTARIFSNVTF